MTVSDQILQVGNPETDNYYDYKGLAEYAWSHAVVSDQVYELINKVCDFKTDNWSNACNDAMNVVFEQYDLIDIYNIYAPKCNLAQTTSSPAADDTTGAESKVTQRLLFLFSLLSAKSLFGLAGTSAKES